jgi:hypothetical protein
MLQTLKVPAKGELAPREAALAKLRGIEAIRVDHKIKPPGGGSSRYVIDLYMRAAPHTIAANGNVSPTAAPHAQHLALHDLTAPLTARDNDKVAGLDPTKTVGKMYLEVHALKDQLAMVALRCQCAKRCRLCQSMFEYIAGLDKTPPAIVRAFSTTEMKKQEIESIVNALVGIAVRAQILTTSSASAGSHCASDEQIPIMVMEFLTL